MRLNEVMDFSQSDAKLANLQKELKDLKYKGGFQTGPVPLQYQNQVNRLKSAISVRQQELAIKVGQGDREADLRDMARQTVRGPESQAEQRARHNQNIGDGIRAGYSIRDKFGGWPQLAQAIEKYIKDASAEGNERVTTDDIVQHFRFPSHRAVDKWLERPEFRRAAQMIGRFN